MLPKKLQQAYSFIVSAIENGDFEESRFFPSAQSLAHLAGVSASTVVKAVRLLKKEGRLAGGHWERAMLPNRSFGSSTQRPNAGHRLPIRKTKCQAVQSRIIQDILNGRYRQKEPLPTEKELAITYNVSPMTLHKALMALVGQSQLYKRGTKFYLESHGAHPKLPQHRIVLVGQGSYMTTNILFGEWHQEYFMLLEQECVRSHLTLEVVCFAREESGLRLINGQTWIPWALDNSSDIEGFIFQVTGANCFDDALLQSLALTGRPVAILDEAGEWPTPAFLKRHSNIRVFRNTVSLRPGQQVARYVLEAGHRQAVFISPYHHLAFSQLRFQSIAQEFSAIDGARVTPVTHADEPEPGQEAAAARLHSDQLLENYTGWVRQLPDSCKDSLYHDFGKLWASIEAGAVMSDLYRLCEQALTIKTATVWIAVNDFCAFWSSVFLDRKGLWVLGGGIPIISFDDDPAFIEKGITSYNFNKAGMIGAMLRYIRYPRLFPAARPVIEIEGSIMPRLSFPRRPARISV